MTNNNSAETSSLMEKLEFGEWKFIRLLGSGTFGKVLLLKNAETDEMIAVKKCHSNSPVVNLDNWKREVEILANLKHPGLVGALLLPAALQILARDSPVLCMEYCNGGDLRHLLNKPVNCCGLLEKDVLHIAHNVTNAVSYLHSLKIVHRDLKPENIVIKQTADNKKSYKLIDLGYAKDLNTQSLCHTMVGTLQYLAPELFTSEKYTNTVDYWSLGLVVHECITGVRPFLPGEPPIQWMQQIENKSRDDICVYAHPDGKLVFSKTLFKENYLSSVKRLMMEDWLRVMLDWEPVRRGRNFITETSQPGPIVFFEKLENILKTEVVSIFWVEGLSQLSYAINNSMTLAEIQEWIERDTGIKRQHQLLILPRGQCADPEKGARQLLALEESTMTVCLFSKCDDCSNHRLSEGYPEFMEIMLSNPRKNIDYRLQKRMWGQSLFFINHQTSLHRKLLHALKIHCTYMTLRAALLKQQLDCISNALRHATSCHDLFASSSRLDRHNYREQSQRGGLPSYSMLEKWAKDEITMEHRVSELTSRFTMLDQMFHRSLASIGETAKEAGSFLVAPRVELDECYQISIELYADLQKRPKEQRLVEDNSVAMAKTVVKALKFRNQLFTDCFTQIRMAEKCSAEADGFPPQFYLLKHDIDQFQEQMTLSQSQRQNDIWTLLERAVTMWQQTSMMNQQTSVNPVSHSGHSDLVSIPSLAVVDASAYESMTTIQENQSLRYEIQDSLSRGLSATCSSTPYNFDWSFLKG